MSCQAIFKTLPTDRGMCCSFNMEKAEEIFQKSTYSALVQDMQSFDESNRYTIILNIHQSNGNHKTYKLLYKVIDCVLKHYTNYKVFKQITCVRQKRHD